MSKPREYIEMVVRVYPETVTRAEIKKRRADAPGWMEDPGDYRRPYVVSIKRVKPPRQSAVEEKLLKMARVKR